MDQVGVMSLAWAGAGAGSGEVSLAGWWMMGGMLGLVGLGRVRVSLNTARRPRSRGGLKGSGSSLSLVARMEECDTPVLGALAIRLAALGVAVCSTGLLMVGRAAAGGLEGETFSAEAEGDTGEGMLLLAPGDVFTSGAGRDDKEDDDDTSSGDCLLEEFVTVAGVVTAAWREWRHRHCCGYS